MIPTPKSCTEAGATPAGLRAPESAAGLPPVVPAAASGKVERASLPAPAREPLAARPGIGGQGNPPRTAERGGTAGAGTRTPAPAQTSATEGTAPPVPIPSRRAGRQGPSAGGARNAPAVYPNPDGRGTQASDGLPAGASPPSSSPSAQGGAGTGAREGVPGGMRAAAGPLPATSPAGSTRSSTSLPAAGRRFPCDCACGCPGAGESDDDGTPGLCDGCRMRLCVRLGPLTPPPAGPAPLAGRDFRDAYRKAQSEAAAAKRRGRGRYPVKRAGGSYRPGGARRMPPGGSAG